MPKPTLLEYQEAIQKPSFCFNDDELKKGKPVAGLLGLPKVISGGFAGVFPIKCGNIVYAVRCFLKDVPDIEYRYKTIGNYLKKVNLPYMVKFQYIEKGIQVGVTWHPIVKMEWVEGDTLGGYLDKYHKDAFKVEEILSQFIKMIGELKENQISHCDLHHSNILVVNNHLYLIDYDAMYVPELHNIKSNEIGHRNFQHPERDLMDFGLFVDNFSEWVIYLSLLAVIKNPKIWDLTNAGDECLIFRKDDFTDFYSSGVFHYLNEIQDQALKKYINFFQDTLTSYDLENVPSIVEANSILNKYSEVTRIVVRGTNLIFQNMDSTTIPDTSWIWDNKPYKFIEFNKPTQSEKIGVFSLFASTFGSFGLYSLAGVSETLLLLSLLTELSVYISYMLVNYRKNPNIYEKKQWVADKLAQISIIDTLNQEIEKIKQDNSDIYEDVSSKIESINEEIKEIKVREQDKLNENDKTYRSKLNEVVRKKRNLQRDENNAINYELKQIQENYLYNRLSRNKIRNASIRGIGQSRTRALIRSGIETAADFTGISINYYNNPNGQLNFIMKNRRHVRVYGIGPAIGQEIEQWRERCVRRASREIPQRLNANDLNRINNKYRKINTDLENNERQLRSDVKINNDKIKKQTKIDEKRLNDQIKPKINYYYNVSGKLKEKVQDITTNLSNEIYEKNRIEHELKSYDNLTFSKYISQTFKSIINL